jgi:cytosine/adenosine deaminase-related metal-dependent hydrolase
MRFAPQEQGYPAGREPGLVIRKARVLTCDPGWTEWAEADIVIDHGRIAALGPGAASAIATSPRDIDGRGLLALPGMVNTHFHSPGNFLKGAVPSLPLELFMLFEIPPFMPEPVSSKYAYLRTLLGAVEMLRQGVTSVHDDAFFLPVATREEISAVMQAYADSGLRATVAIDQPNLVEYDKHAFLAEILPPDVRARMESAPRQGDAELLELYRWFAGEWHGRAGGRLRTAVSCSAPQRVTPAYLRGLADLSEQAGLPYNMHILETRSQRIFGDTRYGMSLVRYAHQQGVLSERCQVIHAVWIDDEDTAILAGSGASVAHNPTCNLRLGSGIMPFRQLADAGVSVGIGTDEANVDDGINFWSAVKNAGLVHNITDPDYERWPTPREVLSAAASGGARALRAPGVTGTLESGAAADIVLMDLNTLPFIPLNDTTRQLVYCEPGRSVRTVIVGGEVVLDGGALRTVDERGLYADIAALAPDIEAFISACAAGARSVADFYARSYRTGLAHSTPLNRWVSS